MINKILRKKVNIFQLIGCLLILAIMGLDLCEAATTEDVNEKASYRLGSGDRVRIMIYREDDLSGEFEVDGSGAISLPLVGEVKAAGLNLREFEETVADAYRDGYLVDPRVSVEVLNYRPFYILGEVKNPGKYPYVSGITVLNAVAMAGGFTYRAREGKAEILRAGEKEASKQYPGQE